MARVGQGDCLVLPVRRGLFVGGTSANSQDVDAF